MSSKDTSLCVLPANVAPQASHPKYMLLRVTGEIKDFQELLMFLFFLMFEDEACKY